MHGHDQAGQGMNIDIMRPLQHGCWSKWDEQLEFAHTCWAAVEGKAARMEGGGASAGCSEAAATVQKQ